MKQPWYYLTSPRTLHFFSGFSFVDKAETKIKIQKKFGVLGDFCWNESGFEILVRRTSAEKLKNILPDIEFSEISIEQSVKTRQRKHHDNLDYVKLEISMLAQQDDNLTTYRIKNGDEVFDGIEMELWDPEIDNYIVVPRHANKGVFIRESTLQGRNVFALTRLPSGTCVTHTFRQAVLELGLTGVGFCEFGDIV